MGAIGMQPTTIDSTITRLQPELILRFASMHF